MQTLDELRERRRLAQEAVAGMAEPRGTPEMDALYEAHAAYFGELGLQLTNATSGSDTDTPPGYQLSTNHKSEWTFCEGGGAWDDEFTAPDREGARLECWSRFARSDTAWAERLLALLTAVVPAVPELPPDYSIGQDGPDALYVLCDKGRDSVWEADGVPVSRAEAVTIAWSVWLYEANEEWREFINAYRGLPK